MMKRSCLRCAFFNPSVTNTYIDYRTSSVGECRVAGPQMEMKFDQVERYRIFPIVDRDDWCGLFASRDNQH